MKWNNFKDRWIKQDCSTITFVGKFQYRLCMTVGYTHHFIAKFGRNPNSYKVFAYGTFVDTDPQYFPSIMKAKEAFELYLLKTPHEMA